MSKLVPIKAKKPCPCANVINECISEHHNWVKIDIFYQIQTWALSCVLNLKKHISRAPMSFTQF